MVFVAFLSFDVSEKSGSEKPVEFDEASDWRRNRDQRKTASDNPAIVLKNNYTLRIRVSSPKMSRCEFAHYCLRGSPPR